MCPSTLDPARAEPGAKGMGLTHFAVALGSDAAVDALTDRLRGDGFPILDGPRRTDDGYCESVSLSPEGNCVEFTASSGVMAWSGNLQVLDRGTATTAKPHSRRTAQQRI